MKQRTFKIPNALIRDTRLSPTARKVGVVLYARTNALGYCHKSLTQIAEQSGCAVSTARTALRELSDAGWITSQKTFVWNAQVNRKVYGKTAYQIRPLPQKGWTLIPRSFLARNVELNPSAFVVAIYLYVAADATRRAFPSIAKIADAVGLSARTVCRTLEKIRHMGEWFVMRCVSRMGDYAANSYHICTVISNAVEEKTSDLRTPLYTYIISPLSKKSKVFLHNGVMTNSANIVITQLTKDIYFTGKNRRTVEIPTGAVCPFVNNWPDKLALHKLWPYLRLQATDF